MFYHLLSAEPFYDIAEPVVKWLTVAVVCALVLVGVVLFVVQLIVKTLNEGKENAFIRKKVFSQYVKYALVGFVFYALAIGILMVVANLVKRTDSDYLQSNYLDKDVIDYVLIPLLVAFGVALISGIALFIGSKLLADRKKFKIGAIALGCLSGAALVAAAVTIAVYYGNHIQDGGYYDGGYGEVDQIVLYVSAAVLIVLAVAGALFLGRNDKTVIDSKCIALAGITVALSFALSYIKLWEMPQGGSITFASLLPVMLFAYVYGPKKGVLVCFIYGILQAVQDPYIIHPAQFLLDYPIAFALTGFAGAFANVKAWSKLPQVKFALGAILGGVLRFIAHVLSGVFAFNAYAIDAQMAAWPYSLAYNSFVFVDLILVIVVGVLLFSSKAFNKQIARYSGQAALKAQTEIPEAEASEVAATDCVETKDEAVSDGTTDGKSEN